MGLDPDFGFENPCDGCKGCCDGCHHYDKFGGNPAYERRRLGLPFRGNFTPLSLAERMMASGQSSTLGSHSLNSQRSHKPKQKKSYFRRY